MRLVAALAEGFDHFQALGVLEPLLQRALVLHLLAQFAGKAFDVHALEKFLDGFRAHHGLEAGGTVLLVKFAELGFVLDDFALFYRSVAGLDHDVGFEVQHGLQVAQRDVEQVPDAAGQSFEEPHVRAGRSQLDVAQAFAANFRQRDFHAALVADHSAVLHPLVLAAETLPIGYRTKDARAEQAVALRLERAVVDGFRLGDFTMRPAPDFFRRCQADADSIEIGNRVCHVKGARTVQGGPPLPAAVSPPLAAPESVASRRCSVASDFSDPRRSGARAAARFLQNSFADPVSDCASSTTEHGQLTTALIRCRADTGFFSPP